MTGLLRERDGRRVCLRALRCGDATPWPARSAVLSASGRALTRISGRMSSGAGRAGGHEMRFDEPPALPPCGSESLLFRYRPPALSARRVAIALTPASEPAAPTSRFAVPAVDLPIIRRQRTGEATGQLLVTGRETASGMRSAARCCACRGLAVLSRGSPLRGEALTGSVYRTPGRPTRAVVVTGSPVASAIRCRRGRDACANVCGTLRNPRSRTAASTRRATLPQSITPVVLAAGRSIAVAISVTVP